MKNKSTLFRNILIASIAVVLVAILFIVYFVWVKPAAAKNKGPAVLYDGEYYDKTTDSLLIFPEHSREEIKTVEVKNENGTYWLDAYNEEGFTRLDLGDKVVYVKTESLENVIKDTEHKLERNTENGSFVILDGVSESYLSTYGLGSDKAKEVKFTSEDGSTYSFFFGDYKDISDGYVYNMYFKGPNDDGTYCVYNIYAITSQNNFVLRGYEDIELDYVSTSTVIVGAGYVTVIAPNSENYRVTDTATKEDLKMYGLDEESNPSYIKVTLHSGEEYKYYIGRNLSSNGGYYIMADGRTNKTETGEYYIVYVLNAETAKALLAPSTSIVTTLICDYIGNDSASITDFRLYRQLYDSDHYSLIMRGGIVTEETKTASNTSYLMLYPGAYILNETKFYSDILTNLAYIYANETLAFGDSVYDSEVYTKYFLDCDKERLEQGTDGNYAKIMYSLEDRNSDGVCSEESYTTIYFSPKQTNETGYSFYYVYSPQRQLISSLDADTFQFIEYSLPDFTNGRLYFNYINSTDYFELICKELGVDVRFTMSGNERTLKAIATKSGENGELLKKINYESKEEEDAIFDLKYEIQKIGNYYDVSYSGDFERFRSLYYVLITRAITTEIDASQYETSEEPTMYVKAQSTKKDQSISYYKYTVSGQRVVDEEGRNVQVRYLGGNIICTNVEVNTMIGGEEVHQVYSVAYYDEVNKKFFTKIVDSHDGYEKPANYAYDDENTLIVTRYLPANTTGEYTSTEYSFEIRDIYTTSIDSTGKEVKRINQTYKLVTPTVTEYTYRIEADGSRTLLKTVVSEGQQSVLIRTQVIEKLFNDSINLLEGREFEKEASN